MVAVAFKDWVVGNQKFENVKGFDGARYPRFERVTDVVVNSLYNEFQWRDNRYDIFRGRRQLQTLQNEHGQS
jgi:hypothetical protein